MCPGRMREQKNKEPFDSLSMMCDWFLWKSQSRRSDPLNLWSLSMPKTRPRSQKENKEPNHPMSCFFSTYKNKFTKRKETIAQRSRRDLSQKYKYHPRTFGSIYPNSIHQNPKRSANKIQQKQQQFLSRRFEVCLFSTYILLLDSTFISDRSSRLRDVFDIVSWNDEFIFGSFGDGDTFQHGTFSDDLLSHWQTLQISRWRMIRTRIKVLRGIIRLDREVRDLQKFRISTDFPSVITGLIGKCAYTSLILYWKPYTNKR